MKLKPFYHCVVLFTLLFVCVVDFPLYAEGEGASDLILQTLARGMRHNNELIRDADGLYIIDERSYSRADKGWVARTLKVRLSYSGERLLKEERQDVWEGREIAYRGMPSASATSYIGEAYDGDYKISVVKKENNIGSRAAIGRKNLRFRGRRYMPMAQVRRFIYVVDDLADILDGSAKSKAQYAVKLLGHDNIEGNECYVVEIMFGNVMHRVTVDPRQGYMPRRAEARNPNGDIRSERTFEYKEYPGGIWYPDKITVKRYSGRAMPNEFTLKVRWFRFNIGLPKEHFRLAIAPGTKVTNVQDKTHFTQPQYPLKSSEIWKLAASVKGNLSAVIRNYGHVFSLYLPSRRGKHSGACANLPCRIRDFIYEFAYLVQRQN